MLEELLTKPGQNPNAPRHEPVIRFCLWLASQGSRLTYKAVHLLSYGVAPKAQPSYQKVLNAIPTHLQWVVCNVDGVYAAKGKSIWGHLKVDPESLPYARPEQVKAVFDLWVRMGQPEAPREFLAPPAPPAPEGEGI